MKTKYITINTKGNIDIIDITSDLEKIVKEENIVDGILFLSVIGSTAAITTIEYEPGLVKDLKETLEKIIPYKEDYEHNFTWQDYNAHSHLRSSFLKTNFFVSVTEGKLDLGTWQQVVLIDFDIRKRQRKIVVKILI
ncbi:MAG: secondary thiamine-phosphate synthase enzyme YjbQ [Candidatus Omnitrophica bacterium]|nr:secondary thiamine-phosphate synthase enzyme YjbQ [Candidatus Omnitrophota bacterium]MCM8831299.1 secondary thiamine-phosphate synthase enzyme YjbQ [Candidatus Omnitrophota bacterium]